MKRSTSRSTKQKPTRMPFPVFLLVLFVAALTLLVLAQLTSLPQQNLQGVVLPMVPDAPTGTAR